MGAGASKIEDLTMAGDAQALLEQLRKKKPKTPKLNRCLHIACFFGHYNCVTLLLDLGAEIASRSTLPFPQKSGIYVEGKDITALHIAALRCHVDVVKYLLSKGADPNIKATLCGEYFGVPFEETDVTALHCCLRSDPRKPAPTGLGEISMLLLEKGNELSVTSQGDTLLHLAALARQTEVARALIVKKADVNARNKKGETPLHLAAQAAMVQVCTLFIAVSGPPQLSEFYKVGKQEGAAQMLILLCRTGGDVNAQDKKGYTPLHAAAYAFSYESYNWGLRMTPEDAIAAFRSSVIWLAFETLGCNHDIRDASGFTAVQIIERGIGKRDAHNTRLAK